MMEQIATAFPLQLEQRNAWERLPDEPAKWYMRFRVYLAQGRKRSVNAVYERERAEKQGNSRTKVSASWYTASRRYQWERRADAYDQAQDDRKADQAREIAARAPFASRPYRIIALNSMASSLERTMMEKEMPAATYLACASRLQSLMHEIAEETATWSAELEQISEAAAFDAIQAKMQRAQEIADAKWEQEVMETDAMIAKAAALDRLVKEMRGK